MKCIFCGCSQYAACAEGCGWVREGARPVCSACVAVMDALAELANRVLDRVGSAAKVRAQLKRAGAAAAGDVR